MIITMSKRNNRRAKRVKDRRDERLEQNRMNRLYKIALLDPETCEGQSKLLLPLDEAKRSEQIVHSTNAPLRSLQSIVCFFKSLFR